MSAAAALRHGRQATCRARAGRFSVGLLLLVAWPAAACELDGLVHGYGPTSALFAGAFHYQALNGLADDADVGTVAPPPPEAAKPGTTTRSFAGWAARRARAASADEAPARWTAPAAASGQPAAGPPQQAEPQKREARQRPPGGGPVP